MGDILVTIYDQNTQAINGDGDISACIETQTTDLLLDLFNLQKAFTSGFFTGTIMANFLCWQWLDSGLAHSLSRILLLMV
ncbi:hypothetical protein BHC44_06690 [Snodgrassella alvi]|jgi:hypothetical protein|nr:hypothetical protein BHC44_06690 [Snodgrassella alvi]